MKEKVMRALASIENPKKKQNLSPYMKFLNLTHADILDHFPEGVFLINTRWQMSYFNHMAEEITGFQREEVLGKFCWDIFQRTCARKAAPCACP